MSELTIRPAYSQWPRYNRILRETVVGLPDEVLVRRPGPDRWPVWATIGHLACQRVFWLCDFAGQPGAAATPFPNAAYDCPGDDDLEHMLDGAALDHALEATFGVVEPCLDSWTLDRLDEVIRHPDWGDGWEHSRGSVLQRVFLHDAFHTAEVNEVLGAAGLPLVDPWD